MLVASSTLVQKKDSPIYLTFMGEYCKINLGKQNTRTQIMTSIEFYERDTVIKRIKDNLNQINHRYFEGNHGILSVTDNGDYVTIKNRGVYLADYDTQKLFDALENFSQDDYESRGCYDLWDYLDHCEYTLPESQKLFVELENLLDEIDCTYFSHCRSKLSIEQQNDEIVNICKNDECLSFFIEPLVSSLNNVSDIDHSFDDLWDYLEYEFQYHGVKSDNELKTDDELSPSEKRQVGLVNMLLGEPVVATETVTLSDEIDNLKNQLMVLSETITQLSLRVYNLEEENKQLKSNQPEAKTKSEPKSKLEKKPTAKRPKFTLPENFADYQQECDDLINALSCFYSVKKGKWGKDILQFILTPTDTEKANQLHSYPDKWKAGLYLHCGYWSMDKVNLSDPDSWEDWFMDINDFADANDIEIS